MEYDCATVTSQTTVLAVRLLEPLHCSSRKGRLVFSFGVHAGCKAGHTASLSYFGAFLTLLLLPLFPKSIQILLAHLNSLSLIE